MGGCNLIKGKLRLLIVLNRFVIGGQAVDTLPLAYFLSRDFHVLILYGEKEKDEIEPRFLLERYPGLHLKKIKFLRRSINPIIDIIAFLQFIYTIVQFKPHIVHTHGAKSGVLGRLSAWLCNVPVIVHTFHGHSFHSYFSKKISIVIAAIERGIGKITTSAIALSHEQKKELSQEFRILPASKITIIHLGFDFDALGNEKLFRDTFRDRYSVQSNDIAIGIVGRIVAIKNHSFFVQVIKRILSLNISRKAAFFIVGDGDLRKKMEEELGSENILFNDNKITAKSRVIFTSWLTNMHEVMCGLDIITLTSLNEGTPLSIIEAQFFKKPVVSTNVGGVKDTIVDKKTGFLIEKSDVETFSKKITLLINDDELRVRMGEAGYQYASEKFSKQKEVLNTKEFYFSLLQKKGFKIIH